MATKKKTSQKAVAATPLDGRSRFARINAVGKVTGRNRLSLLTRLRPDGRIDASMESYGSIVDIYLEDNSWITSIFRLTSHNGVGRMYYGDKTFDDNRTNIYSKQLEVGEMFSVHYDVDDPNADIVFQIEEIIFY